MLDGGGGGGVLTKQGAKCLIKNKKKIDSCKWNILTKDQGQRIEI